MRPRSLLLPLSLSLFLGVAGCDAGDHDHDVIGNDVVVVNFSFDGSDLDVNTDATVGSYQRSVSAITDDIFDEGAVLLYADGELILDGGAGTWTALPVTQGVDLDDDLIVDYTLTFTYSYDVGDLYVDIISSATGTVFEDLPRTDFKLIVIAGGPSGTLRGVDRTNYEAVRQALGIAAE